jgi:hypothetical protein
MSEKCPKVKYRNPNTAIAAAVRLSATSGKGWRYYRCGNHYHLTTRKAKWSTGLDAPTSRVVD